MLQVGGALPLEWSIRLSTLGLVRINLVRINLLYLSDRFDVPFPLFVCCLKVASDLAPGRDWARFQNPGSV